VPDTMVMMVVIMTMGMGVGVRMMLAHVTQHPVRREY
jgi:hypothetical protein